MIVTHSIHNTFYLPVLTLCNILGCIDLARHLGPQGRNATDFVHAARGWIARFANIICLTVCCTLGHLGGDGEFHFRQVTPPPLPSNTNMLLWPAVVDCPYATATRSFCALGLRHTGTRLGHWLVPMLGASTTDFPYNPRFTLPPGEMSLILCS